MFINFLENSAKAIKENPAEIDSEAQQIANDADKISDAMTVDPEAVAVEVVERNHEKQMADADELEATSVSHSHPIEENEMVFPMNTPSERFPAKPRMVAENEITSLKIQKAATTLPQPITKVSSEAVAPAMKFTESKQEAEAQVQPPAQVGVVSGGRERLIHLIDSLPPELRHVVDWQAATPQAQQLRFQTEYLSQMAAAQMLNYCATRVPLRYLPHCKAMLMAFPRFTQGLQYGDQPEQLCIRYDFCPPTSYIAAVPHAVTVINLPSA